MYIFSGGSIMDIIKKKTGTELLVKVVGRLDTNTAPDLESSVLPDLKSCKKLILELSELDYISSAGLRVVLTFYKSLSADGKTMVVKHVNDEVMEVFDMTGFSSFLVFEE